MPGPLVPHRGMSAWARPLDNNEGTETKGRVRRAAAPSPYPLGGMQPRPGTPSYEDTTIHEQGTGWSSFPPHITARRDTTQHGKTHHNAAQRSTAQHGTAQHNTTQHSIAPSVDNAPNDDRGQRGSAATPPKRGESTRACPPPPKNIRNGNEGRGQRGRTTDPHWGTSARARPPDHKQGAGIRRHPNSPLIGNGAGAGCKEPQR